MLNKKKRIIEKQIFDEVSKIKVPDVSKSILERVQLKNEYQTNNLKNDSNINDSYKRKSIINGFTKLAVVLSAFVLGLFVLLSVNEITPSVKSDVSKPHQTFAFQAVTLFNYADSYSQLGLLSLNNSKYQEIAEEINEYYLTALNVLNRENIIYQQEESNDSNYQNMIIINSKLLNNNYQYILYFNEDIINSEDDDKDIDEVDSKISGIIKVGNEFYLIEGTKEVEKDECEIELKMYLSDTEYLEVTQEVEKKENEYSYKYYKNGQLIQEFEMTIVTKSLGKKVIELENETVNNEASCEFSFYNNHVKVEYEINDEEGTVEIFEEENNYRYEFKNKIKIFIKKSQ